MRFILLLCIALWPLAGQAQQGKDSQRYARILALGTKPPFRTKMTPTGRVQLPPPPGSTPPSIIAIDEKAGGDTRGQSVQLGKISEPFAFPAKGADLDLKAGEQAGAEVWKTVPKANNSHGLLLMWRPEGADHWDKSQAGIIDDSTRAFPSGQMRLINLSKAGVVVFLNGEKKDLGGGKSRLEGLKKGENTLDVRATVGNRTYNLRSERFTIKDGERVNAIVWRADAKGAPTPVELFFQVEPAVNYQPKKRGRR